METSTQFTQGPAYDSVERTLEWPMMFLAVGFVVTSLMQEMGNIPPEHRGMASVVEWGIWGLFVAEYMTLLLLSRDRRLYV